jgi:DNA invertase Pin-like site-specific DNA recombinase
MFAAPMGMMAAGDQRADGDALAAWAEGLANRRGETRGRRCLRFAFYGRVSTEDWQDPVTSRARQLQQAMMLVAGPGGGIVAEFFDAGESRALPRARRPQAAALVAQLADRDRGWDAIVIGEYERAFYGNQYVSMAPLFEQYGISLWMPEVGGRVDWHAEDHEQTMLALGLSSKREITRTRIRIRTAMAAQTREQGRYLSGRPPYGYRLGDAGPHPNKAHAAWGRRAHRLEPDPAAAPVVTWMFAQRPAGHSAARITRALNDAGVPCPSAADPGRNPHRTGAAWKLRTVAAILANPRYTGRQVWNRQRTDFDLADPADTTLGHRQVQRWNLPEGWVISRHPRPCGAGQRGRLHRRPGRGRAKGPRWYDWALIEVTDPVVTEGTGPHWLLIRRRISDGEYAFYRAHAPRPVPLAQLVRVAGSRWKVEDGFAGGKELAALDEHQVRSWTSWHRWTILALLAHAFLAVLAAQPGAGRAHEDQMIPLTRHEIRRLFTGLCQQPPAPAAQLHWSWWRRRHQATARACHYRRRALALS